MGKGSRRQRRCSILPKVDVDIGKSFERLASWIFATRSLWVLQALTSCWRPFGPLDFVLRAHRALNTHEDPRSHGDPCVGDWIVC